MKKIASLLLIVVMLISCVAALSSCGSESEYKKFDDLVSFISEKGSELGSENKITKNLSGFYGAGNNSTVVTVRYDSMDGKIVLEETTEYDTYTVYYKAICDQNADNVPVTVEYTYPDHKVYYKGYIMEGSFCDTNKKISAFETNASLDEAEAMDTLGTAIDSLFSHANALLGNVGSPVSLYDIGFNSAYK